MRGFAETALIIYPHIDTLQGKGHEYLLLLKSAVVNMCEYLSSQGIQAECFNTDEGALEEAPTDYIKWLDGAPKEDLAFVQRISEGEIVIPEGRVDQDIMKKVREKVPIPIGTQQSERADLFDQREKLATQLLIKKAKIIIDFGTASRKKDYTVKPKENDQKIILKVHPSTFKVDCYMGGNQMDIVEVLQCQKARRPLYRWDVN